MWAVAKIKQNMYIKNCLDLANSPFRCGMIPQVWWVLYSLYTYKIHHAVNKQDIVEI